MDYTYEKISIDTPIKDIISMYNKGEIFKRSNNDYYSMQSFVDIGQHYPAIYKKVEKKYRFAYTGYNGSSAISSEKYTIKEGLEWIANLPNARPIGYIVEVDNDNI